MRDYFTEQLGAVKGRVARLEGERVTYRQVEVLAVDPAGFITVDVDGQPLSGIEWPAQFLPVVGDRVTVPVEGATPKFLPNAIAEGAVGERELNPEITQSIEQAVTLANGKNSVTWAATTPSFDGTAVGDTWWQRDGAILVGAWEWDGAGWQPRTFGDAVFANIVADKILTGTLGAGVAVYVGDPAGDHTAIDGTAGVVARVDDPVDGTPNEVARFGRTSGGTDPVTGEQTWAIDEDGNGSFREGSFKSLRVGGVELSTSMEDKAGALAVWFPGGKLQGSIAVEFGVAEVYRRLEPNRNYVVTVSATCSSTENNGEVDLRLRGTSDGSRPTVASAEMMRRHFTTPVGGRWESRDYSFVLQRDADDALDFKLLLTVARGSGQTTGTVATAGIAPVIRVVDAGPWIPQSGTSLNDGSTGGTSTPAPTRHVYRADATWAQNFKGSGAVRTDTTDLVQGYNSTNGDGRSMIGWPDLTSMLSGATIESVKLWLYAYHWHYIAGGTAILGTHAQTAAPGAFSGTPNRIQVGGWKRAEGRWLDLTGWKAEFQSGASRGITLGPSGGTDLTFYGRFLGVSDTAHPDLRPELEIIYYK